MSFNFSTALSHMKVNGSRIARTGWNGKGMFIFRVDSWANSGSQPKGTERMEHLPFIAMKTADNKVVPWLASQTDILADDWEVVS